MCTVICCGCTVSFLSNIDRPLHLHSVLDFAAISSTVTLTICLIFHLTMMAWERYVTMTKKPYEKAGDNSL